MYSTGIGSAVINLVIRVFCLQSGSSTPDGLVSVHSSQVFSFDPSATVAEPPKEKPPPPPPTDNSDDDGNDQVENGVSVIRLSKVMVCRRMKYSYQMRKKVVKIELLNKLPSL